MVRNRPKGATRIRRRECRVREQSAIDANLAYAFDELLAADSLFEQFENLEVIHACMVYVGENSCWPTPMEIAAKCKLDLNHILAVEERLSGTYEFALRSGLIEERS